MAIEAVVSQLNSSALNKAVNNSQGAANVAQNQNNGKSFAEIINKIDSGEEFANQIGALNNSISPTENMNVIEGESVSFKPEDGITEVGGPATSEKVLGMLGDVNQGQMQMDSLVNHIVHSGKKFSNQELLVIQAHVYHFAQMSELTVKVAEQSISSVKAVLNTQVQ